MEIAFFGEISLSNRKTELLRVSIKAKLVSSSNFVSRTSCCADGRCSGLSWKRREVLCVFDGSVLASRK